MPFFDGTIAEAVASSRATLKPLIVLLSAQDSTSAAVERSLLSQTEAEHITGSVLLHLDDDLEDTDPASYTNAKFFRVVCPTNVLPTVAMLSHAGSVLAVLKGRQQLSDAGALHGALRAAFQEVKRQQQALLAARACALLAQHALQAQRQPVGAVPPGAAVATAAATASAAMPSGSSARLGSAGQGPAAAAAISASAGAPPPSASSDGSLFEHEDDDEYDDQDDGVSLLSSAAGRFTLLITFGLGFFPDGRSPLVEAVGLGPDTPLGMVFDAVDVCISWEASFGAGALGWGGPAQQARQEPYVLAAAVPGGRLRWLGPADAGRSLGELGIGPRTPLVALLDPLGHRPMMSRSSALGLAWTAPGPSATAAAAQAQQRGFQLQISYHNGLALISFSEQFGEWATLGQVFAAVDRQMARPGGGGWGASVAAGAAGSAAGTGAAAEQPYVLVVPHPRRRQFGPGDERSTLRQLGIARRASLAVVRDAQGHRPVSMRGRLEPATAVALAALRAGAAAAAVVAPAVSPSAEQPEGHEREAGLEEDEEESQQQQEQQGWREQGEGPRSGQTYTLQLRIPDGTSFTSQFDASATLAQVFAAVDHHRHHHSSCSARGSGARVMEAAAPYLLVQRQPRRQFGPADAGRTLCQLGITPCASLAVAPHPAGHRPSALPASVTLPTSHRGPVAQRQQGQGQEGQEVGADQLEAHTSSAAAAEPASQSGGFSSAPNPCSQRGSMPGQVGCREVEAGCHSASQAPATSAGEAGGSLGPGRVQLEVRAGEHASGELLLGPATPQLPAAGGAALAPSAREGGRERGQRGSARGADTAAAPPSFTLQFKQPDGPTLIGEFEPEASLQQVFAFVGAHRSDGAGQFALVQPFPRRKLGGPGAEAELCRPLAQLGLGPRSLLLIEPTTGPEAGTQAGGRGWSLGRLLRALNPLSLLRGPPLHARDPTQPGDPSCSQERSSRGEADTVGAAGPSSPQ